jgi:hypothetical protein
MEGIDIAQAMSKGTLFIIMAPTIAQHPVRSYPYVGHNLQVGPGQFHSLENICYQGEKNTIH